MSTNSIVTLMGSGLKANRPADPDTAAGGAAFYYATDESILYVWDKVAGSWDNASGGSAGGGAWTYENTYTASAQAELDVTIPADRMVMLVIDHAIPATDSVNLRARVTTDSFSSEESGASDYRWLQDVLRTNASGTGTGSSVSGDGDEAYMVVANSLGNDTGENLSGRMYITGHGNTTYKTLIEGRLTALLDSLLLRRDFWGNYNATTVVDGLRFYFSSGNISTMRVHVYSLVIA